MSVTLIQAFLSRRVARSEGSSVGTTELHEAFEEYCLDINLDLARVPSIVTFGMVMFQLGYRSGIELDDIEKATGNRRTQPLRRWQGIHLLPVSTEDRPTSPG